jgi:hypothetical protein
MLNVSAEINISRLLYSGYRSMAILAVQKNGDMMRKLGLD